MKICIKHLICICHIRKGSVSDFINFFSLLFDRENIWIANLFCSSSSLCTFRSSHESPNPSIDSKALRRWQKPELSSITSSTFLFEFFSVDVTSQSAFELSPNFSWLIWPHEPFSFWLFFRFNFTAGNQRISARSRQTVRRWLQHSRWDFSLSVIWFGWDDAVD